MSTERKTGELLMGRYRIRRPLGEGAHGRVYLADDLARGGSRVALKLVETALGATSANPAETLLRWFRHPGWAAVYDAGPLGEAARFQVARFIPGASLDGIEDSQPSSHVWRLLEDMARVLRALHGQGLIHYDLTPGNVIRSDDHGEISFTLTDGGLAHVGPVQGVARGTPQFMAPELTEAGSHDHRVDLYSLGLVAYRMITGRDPFSGGAGEVLKARREHDAPRASTHAPDIPAALDEIIASLLARDPNERPFDASTLLERLSAARRDALPVFTEAEAVEAAAGGPLVGRKDVITRFERTARQLAQNLPAPDESRRRQPISGMKEPVLLIRGEPGSGATHLVETLFADAREEGLPAMLLAGRERAADRRGPLRRLADGVAALGRAPGEKPERVRLDLRQGAGLQREEQALARGRAIEVFLKTVEEAASRTPFVLVVEDFGDLPEQAKEAVQVLSRHLLSRAEHGGRQAQPAVALVVDLGAEAADNFLIPDSEEPDRCIEEAAPLAADDLEAICQSRFGGLRILEEDRDNLVKRTEGRPAVLAGLLSEAARRGDLKFEADAWHWNLEALNDYPVRRGISPQHAEELAVLPSSDRLVLEQIALIDSAIDATVMDLLCERAGLARVPSTPLLSIQDHSNTTSYAIANRGVRQALLEALTDDTRLERARSLL
ncbi:MAG: serine/threonine-protein kinase, partial [Planctomycetota bacterium]|nr:serine/threonine-protein kinase [Planctomycetota bacterium]